MEQAGMSRLVAMKITGRGSESVYRRYAIVSGADLQATSKKLETHSSLIEGSRKADQDERKCLI
jgi:hypothetical protein